ncbi:unnamed protein product, partial [Symbiodinium sp. KB8]
MAGESSDYDTAVKYLSDLTEVFAHQHDTEAVDSIRDLQLQLASAFQVQQTSAKDLIAALSKDVERAEQAALRPGDEATFRERMEELDQQRQQVLAAIGALSQERAATLEQVQALKTQLQAVNEAVQQLEHEQAV